MLFLTKDEHRIVLDRLVTLGKSITGVPTHDAGIEFTSLLSCFHLHCIGAAQSILALETQFGSEWFPTTTGYIIARSIFEVDVTSHYIALDPTNRSRQYIDFEKVILKNKLEAVERNLTSPNVSWKEGAMLEFQNYWAPKKASIDAEYSLISSQFEVGGKRVRNWSGKSLYGMAKAVDHVEAYESYYSDLSSFAHVDVMMANRFLRNDGLSKGDGPAWSMRAEEGDVGKVYLYADTFLTCFLMLLGKEFKFWDDKKVLECWNFPEAAGRESKITRK